MAAAAPPQMAAPVSKVELSFAAMYDTGVFGVFVQQTVSL
jgi:hypothetical protein